MELKLNEVLNVKKSEESTNTLHLTMNTPNTLHRTVKKEQLTDDHTTPLRSVSVFMLLFYTGVG